MDDTEAVFLRQIISKISGARKFEPTTKLFHDLGISGDDAWELLEAVHTRFGASFESFRFADYFPNETEALGVYWTSWLGSGRRFRPFTIEHLSKVIDHGAWLDP